MPEEKAVMNLLNDEFKAKTTPKELESIGDLFLFQCPCGSVHFRHAGYVEGMMPYMRGDVSKHVATDSHSVKICVKCKHAYIWINDQVYDITKFIDLEAWEKFEKVAHKATGPGGEC